MVIGFWAKFGQKLSRKIKKGLRNLRKPLIFMARPAGFEPATYGFVVLFFVVFYHFIYPHFLGPNNTLSIDIKEN